MLGLLASLPHLLVVEPSALLALCFQLSGDFWLLGCKLAYLVPSLTLRAAAAAALLRSSSASRKGGEGHLDPLNNPPLPIGGRGGEGTVYIGFSCNSPALALLVTQEGDSFNP